MHIPLDYYRILGLPIQATADQLRQAHRDRTVQLPRREYSDTAIASRRHLLDEAFAVLSDPEQRNTYDTGFLAKTYEITSDSATPTLLPPTSESLSDSHTTSINIPDRHLVGALLLLQELGEYELVLKLGRPFLTGGSASLKDGDYGDPSIVFADIVLTVALACLELGREQWQHGQYENAAEALDTGQQLLLREGLFVSVRGEIQADLYKLRPYRVLELLALPEDQTEERLAGIQLLREMLHERGGIDGSGNDQSGLNIDDFLRFIQQLRSYLTAAEQQVLFEEEARRPSAVAVYLAVYALMARGFADRQPALIRRAKQLLLRLSSRQDVHLEQAVCTLLLGQTEEASRALELSQEYEPIAFIREHSQGSPDLLPGLCRYAEHWLQDEVFPHFRDLARKRVALKDYFADPQVQAYLEELPNESDAQEWSHGQASREVASVRELRPAVASDRRPEPVSIPRESAARPLRPALSVAGGDAPPEPRSTDALIETARARIAARMGGTATLTSDRAPSNVATMPAAERVAPATADSPTEPASRLPDDRASRRDRSRTGPGLGSGPRRDGGAKRRSEDVPPPVRPAQRRSQPVWRRWLLPAAILFGVMTAGFGLAQVLRMVQASSQQAIQTDTMLVPLDRPLVTLEAAGPQAATAALTNTTAKQAIESWFSAKSAAMGPEHAASKLEDALTEPKLSEWRKASQDAKRDNWYKQYKHAVKVNSVEPTKDKPDQATVLAEVSETTDYYEAGSLVTSTTDQNLRVQYNLARKDSQWRIQNWQVLQ
ncbi:DUF4101 domain-containing protein [Leptolyngbya sp. FACHB-36]|uniref:IMS domain-containing protein n=1 Tax=Leptolyngbya sp. FACHB-36 TaxID=2692808 RepID=UPI0016815183|nr:DUF4101 domain-containing protein [Leptolyngbya sp. FACHB-36]